MRIIIYKPTRHCSLSNGCRHRCEMPSWLIAKILNVCRYEIALIGGILEK